MSFFFFPLTFRNWSKRSKNSRHRSLLSVILRTFWKDFIRLTLLCFCNDIIIRLGQPYLLGYLLRYFQNDTNIPFHNALMYAIGFVLLNISNALLNNHIQMASFHIGMKVRVATCSLIYRKVNHTIN